MGDLTDDISRLCGEIETLRNSRKVFESQLDKENTEMKAEVSKMRAGFRKDQNNMAVRTRADRVEFVSGLEAEVNGLLNAFDKAHAEMATHNKKSIVAFVSDVVNHVSGLLASYKKDRKAMGEATKQENTIFVGDVTRFVNAEKKETKVMMDGFRAKHKKMANVTKADRKEFVSKLKNSVGIIRKVNADDLAGARAVWAGRPKDAKRRVDR